MKGFYILAVFYCLTHYLVGQTNVSENYSFIAGERVNPKNAERVRLVLDDYFYTVTLLSDDRYPKYLSKYDNAKMSEVWKVKLPEKLKIDGVKLRIDTSFFNNDGSSLFLASGYSKKTKALSIYQLSYGINGEKANKELLTTIPCSSSDYLVNYINSNDFIHIICTTDLKSSSRMTHAYQYDKSTKNGSLASIRSTYEYEDMDHAVYSRQRNSVLFIGAKKKELTLFSCDFNQSTLVKTELEFDDFRLVQHAVSVNPINGEFFVTGLTKEKSSIDGMAIIKVNDSNLLTPIKYPLARTTVEDVIKNNSPKERENPRTRSAIFRFKSIEYTKQGNFYVIYEDVELASLIKLRGGVLIWKFDDSFNQISQIYLPCWTYGQALVRVNEESIDLIGAFNQQRMNEGSKSELNMCTDCKVSIWSLGKYSVDEAGTSFSKIADFKNKYIVTENPKVIGENKSIFMFRSHAAVYVYMGKTSEKRSFLKAKPN